MPESQSDFIEAMSELRSLHEMRVRFSAAELDKGLSIGDPGRQFDFPRQLATRYAKEARGSGASATTLLSYIRHFPHLQKYVKRVE